MLVAGALLSFGKEPLVWWLAASPLTWATKVQAQGPAHWQFGFMPKIEVHTCYISRTVQTNKPHITSLLQPV